MNNFSPFSALLGGALIGLAASIFLLAQGRIFGVSGILGGLLRRSADVHGLRLAVIGGLLAGGAVLRLVFPAAFQSSFTPSLLNALLAGLLVGVGTQLGNGCTSGHGVCGISRLSVRSMVATATFMLTGIVTVFLTRHVFGGAS